MKIKICLTMIIASILLILPSGCAKKPSSDDKVLATVSNKTITLSDFKFRMSKLPAYYQAIAEKDRKRYLEDMIVETLFYEAAVRKGLNRDREVNDLLNEAKKKIMVGKFVKVEVDDKIRVSEDEMRKFYEENKSSFKTPAMWRASHILVGTDQEARAILDELAKGAKFEDLARQKSMDATSSRGGDIGYFRTGQLVGDFEKACITLSPGQTSDVVHTQFGYHVIKLTDKKDAGVGSYEDAKAVIETELKKKKRRDEFDKLVLSLKEKYGVKIQDDSLQSLESLGSEATASGKRQ